MRGLDLEIELTSELEKIVSHLGVVSKLWNWAKNPGNFKFEDRCRETYENEYQKSLYKLEKFVKFGLKNNISRIKNELNIEQCWHLLGEAYDILEQYKTFVVDDTQSFVYYHMKKSELLLLEAKLHDDKEDINKTRVALKHSILDLSIALRYGDYGEKAVVTRMKKANRYLEDLGVYGFLETIGFKDRLVPNVIGFTEEDLEDPESFQEKKEELHKKFPKTFDKIEKEKLEKRLKQKAYLEWYEANHTPNIEE